MRRRQEPRGRAARQAAREAARAPVCPVCHGRRPQMETCDACRGRGVMDRVGFCTTPWDEIVPGLWVGGHDVADPETGQVGPVVVADQFDLVVSLFEREGHGPPEGVPHRRLQLADAELTPADRREVLDLARWTAEQVAGGARTLVRCQAGLNRSSLVAALVLLRHGLTAQQAIDLIRARRAPMALFNPDFEAFVRSVGPDL